MLEAILISITFSVIAIIITYLSVLYICKELKNVSIYKQGFNQLEWKILLFYPLSVILLCIAIHQPNISKEVFGGFIFASGAVISIILGVIGLLFSLFSGLNIPYRKKDIFSDY